jgi:hypothetical protein
MSLHQMPPSFEDPKLENALRKAFERQEPPDGFADRVIARLPDGLPKKNRSAPAWRREWLAIAASACMGVIGIGAWQQHQREVQGEKAKQELIYALTVASESLQMTKQLVKR